MKGTAAITKADYEKLAAFRYALRQFLRFSEDAARAVGIEPQQHQALLAIKGFPERDWVTIGELADKLSIERTTLSRNLAIMETAAWISIRPGDDARSRLVSVTNKGRAAVSASFDAWRRAQATVAAAIGPSGVGALRALSRTQLG